MNGMFKEVLKKAAKDGKYIDKDKADRKREVLDEIDSVIGGEMGDKIRGMKKVSVIAKDEEGLKEGLEKAEEIVDELPIDEESEHGESEHGESEHGESKHEEYEKDMDYEEDMDYDKDVKSDISEYSDDELRELAKAIAKKLESKEDYDDSME